MYSSLPKYLKRGVFPSRLPSHWHAQACMSVITQFHPNFATWITKMFSDGIHRETEKVDNLAQLEKWNYKINKLNCFRQLTAHLHCAQAQWDYLSRKKEANNFRIINLQKKESKLILLVYLESFLWITTNRSLLVWFKFDCYNLSHIVSVARSKYYYL